MKKTIICILFYFIMVSILFAGGGRNYRFSDSKLNLEFDNIYYCLQEINPQSIWLQEGNKLYFDNDKDTYITFNSSNNHIEFYIDNEIVGHIDKATGFVND